VDEVVKTVAQSVNRLQQLLKFRVQSVKFGKNPPLIELETATANPFVLTISNIETQHLHHTPNPTHDYTLRPPFTSMKTSILILLSTVLAASTMVKANFHLRASTPQDQEDQDADTSLDRKKRHKKKPSPKGNWGFMGADITVTHVSDDKTNFDEEKVSEAFIQAYNNVHNNGYRITLGFIDKAVAIPEGADFSNNQGETEDNLLFSTVTYYLPFGYDCPNCPAEFGLGGEDDTLERAPKPADDSKVHEKFESVLLKKLHSSDMDAFAGIQGVEIVFTYTDPIATATATTTTTADDEALAEEHKTKLSNHDNMHGQIEIMHLTGSANDGSSTVIDMETLGEMYQESFDAVYSNMGYEVTRFNLEREIHIPEETFDAEAEDSLESYYYYFTSVYSYAYDYGCTLCPPEALLSSPVDLVAMHGAHRFLEKFFCHKMKLAGPLQFKKISHCSIDLDHAATLDDSFAADGDGASSSQ
jgi:hypothetical protein